MKTLTVILEQHTPLIHFQHDQYGATLRASEVKPKLDRFLLGKLGVNEEDGKKEAEKKGWIIKGKELALNYKMRIIPKGEVKTWEINVPKRDRKTGNIIRKQGRIQMEPYPLFFANLNKDYEKPDECKLFSFVDRLQLELSFTNELQSLHDWIKENLTLLSRFFFFTNFGTRSSKGFGSFYPSKEDKAFVPFGAKNKYIFNSKYMFSLKPNNNVENIENRSRDLFDGIELLYNALRGGVNIIGRDRFCFQSLMQLYCEERLRRYWEKEKIVDTMSYIQDHSDEEYYDVKDLLGYSKSEEWKALYNAKISKEIAVEDGRGGWKKPTEEEKNRLPQRMKSPILFKPLYDKQSKCYTVYIRPVPKTVDLPGFIAHRKMCVSIDTIGEDLFFDLPQNFTLGDFLDYIFRCSNLDLSTYVEEKFQSKQTEFGERKNPYYVRLRRIYNEIVNNLKWYPQQ